MRRNQTIRDLDLIAAKIRRNTLEICRQRGGYAAQGVALADIAATLYFDELRPDGDGWFHDRFVLSNGHDAIMTMAHSLKRAITPWTTCARSMRMGHGLTKAQLRGSWGLR